MQHWLCLFAAILFEVSGTTAMKFSEGFTKLMPSILIFIFYGVAFFCLTIAIKKIDMSIAYAIWSGVGTALIAGIGIFYFHEPATLFKLFFLGLIITGVVGLNYSGLSH
ncbi:MAG: multidrug efflux SMR transporter [Proteobacteria bacterium]|nr:multidrug efflux SMR transporter [Pseudomonadota bacterium]